MTNLTIRQEQTSDYDVVYQIIKAAFESSEYSDGNEQDLVAELRKSKSFIPELSLVAIEEDRIVGHILFTKAFVGRTEVLALAPISVLPKYQNRGIGLSLIEHGHIIAAELGYEYSVVLGNPKFYYKSGYVPASEYGIKAPFDVSDENFMAMCFSHKEDKLNGCMQYDKAFGL